MWASPPLPRAAACSLLRGWCIPCSGRDGALRRLLHLLGVASLHPIQCSRAVPRVGGRHHGQMRAGFSAVREKCSHFLVSRWRASDAKTYEPTLAPGSAPVVVGATSSLLGISYTIES